MGLWLSTWWAFFFKKPVVYLWILNQRYISCTIIQALPNNYLNLVDRRSTKMPDTVNSYRTKQDLRSQNYLTGLLLFGMLGLGTLSIAGCESSTPPEPLAETDLALNNPPPASPLSSNAISSLPTASSSTPAPVSPAVGLTSPPPAALAPKPKPSYVRPTTAENGQPFPKTSGYIKKYPQKANDGYSSLTIKNDENDSDIYIKVFDLNKSKAKPVRFFFVRARESFTVEKITPGKYDVRYRDLDSGSTTKTQDFKLEETKEKDGGIKYSNMTMTLYKVADGNMQTELIDEEAFE